MTPSPSTRAAATTLAGWARERRSGWSDIPLDIPIPLAILKMPRMAEPVEFVAPMAEPVEFSAPMVEPSFDLFEDLIERPVVDLIESPVVGPTEEFFARPSVFVTSAAALKACTTRAVNSAIAAFARLEPLGEPVAEWLMRGAAVVSTMSVVMFIGINRGEVFARLDRASAIVVAATKRAEPPAPPVDLPPAGTGRLTVASAEGTAQVLIDGLPKGSSPLTVDLPAGAHHVLLRSSGGSIERVVRIRAGEPSEVTESIFPGWVALTTAVDLTMSEEGQPLKRDDRGWAMLPPGPHDIHLDNRVLGVHEVRHVVVTPGDTTRLSFMAHASTMSLTTNEVADVWIDGASFGQAPLVDQPISIGVHDVRLRSALHEKWLRIRATVQPVQINVDLTAQ